MRRQRSTLTRLAPNLAEYLIPVNADIGDVKVILAPENDTRVNPLGVKGIGELGNVGVNAAVANAVFHATGERIRDLLIRIEKLLSRAQARHSSKARHLIETFFGKSRERAAMRHDPV
jgi:CO/xanthine dehydrogenase Mo-binding subunit